MTSRLIWFALALVVAGVIGYAFGTLELFGGPDVWMPVAR